MEKEEDERREKIQNQFRHAAIEMANKIKTNNKKIEEHVKLFKDNYGRDPLKEELFDSLKNDVDAEILAKFLEKYVPNGGGDDNV